MMIKLTKSIALTIFLTASVCSKSLLASTGPSDIVGQYIKAIRENNRAEAKSLWLSEEIEKSAELGIIFTGIEAKYDCASPLIYDHNRLMDYTEKINLEYIDSLDVRANLSLTGVGRDSIHIPYYLTQSGDGWKLCSPMYIYTKGWQNLPTRYFNIHYDDSSLINDFASHRLDSFIDSLEKQLNISSERIHYLGESKIDYYLCNDNQMKLITGYAAQGMTNFQFDAIITCYLPHYHELVHLINNYALKECPLFTLPILQEGLACCLGGRWGKSPGVINYWGNVSLNLGLADLDDILTANGFHNCPGGSDAAYAISSLFAGSLIDGFGIQKLKTFYTLLSGTNEYVNSLSPSFIKTEIEKIFITSWQEIEANFKNFTNRFAYGGIEPSTAPLDKDVFLEIESDNISAVVWDNSGQYVFQIKLESGSVGGALVLTVNSISIDSQYQSRFFKEQFPDKNYQGEIYGIQFSEGECGLYDYQTNMLLAKYVAGFTPNQNYWDSDARIITFGLDKKLLDRDMSGYHISLIEAR